MLFFIILSVPPAIYSINSRMIDERRSSILKKLVMVCELVSAFAWLDTENPRRTSPFRSLCTMSHIN